jgi:hypothetical protein
MYRKIREAKRCYEKGIGQCGENREAESVMYIAILFRDSFPRFFFAILS